ncbi:hypothetical protein BJ138DRAFT_1005171 [Hygrophoropsis aurantiaca]|uniref:Uncharacterized protein n=1 Tax=Hygrophoropsis aurantiaca TaxID=72124 RepID=A0ACB8AFB4_9AGAM|nr:hypothetical protein BJ138DRAFT_1005171 [Hygrophoropsis aurantiaca]
MSGSSLIHGYKQVESFGPEEDYEEEEISYVTLDLGAVEPTLVPSSSSYRLIGLDTPTPFLQLSGSIFKGRHDALLGTELLFTEEKRDNDRHRRSVSHFTNTEQRIRFKEVELKPKVEVHSQQPHNSVSAQKNSDAPTAASQPAGQTLEHMTGNKPEVRTRKRRRKAETAPEPDSRSERETPAAQNSMDIG